MISRGKIQPLALQTKHDNLLTLSGEASRWAWFVAQRSGRPYASYLRMTIPQLEREIAHAIVAAAQEIASGWPKDKPTPDDDPDNRDAQIGLYERAVSRLVRNQRAIAREKLAREQAAAVAEFRAYLRGDPDDDDE